NDFGDLTNSWPPRVEREIHVLGHRDNLTSAPASPYPCDREVHQLLSGKVGDSNWRATGGRWTFGQDAVTVAGDDQEWVTLESNLGVVPPAEGENVLIELTVSGKGEAAGVSFGHYRDLLAPLSESVPRRLRLEIDPHWGTW